VTLSGREFIGSFLSRGVSDIGRHSIGLEVASAWCTVAQSATQCACTQLVTTGVRFAHTTSTLRPTGDNINYISTPTRYIVDHPSAPATPWAGMSGAKHLCGLVPLARPYGLEVSFALVSGRPSDRALVLYHY